MFIFIFKFSFILLQVDQKVSSLHINISCSYEQCESRAERYCYVFGAFVASAVAKGRISQLMDQFLCGTLGSVSGFA
jgi:hypothetical protein